MTFCEVKRCSRPGLTLALTYEAHWFEIENVFVENQELLDQLCLTSQVFKMKISPLLQAGVEQRELSTLSAHICFF